MLKLVKRYKGNKVRQHLNSWFTRKTNEAESEEAPWQLLEDPQVEQPEDKHKQQRAITELDKALHALPVRQQQVFILRQWEGLSVVKTAKVMGCSDGSVKTHSSRALQSLRNKLEGHWL